MPELGENFGQEAAGPGAGIPRLLLLSNGKMKGGYLEYAQPWVAELYGASPVTPKTILFVPYALKDHDAYLDKAAKALAPLGITVISAHSVPDPVVALEQVDGVFVGGGNTFRLLAQLQKTGLLEAIKAKVQAGMPYMGASAGINVAGPTIMTTNDMPIVEPENFRAMGLVPFQINPHYVDGKFYYEETGEIVPYNGETREERIAQYHEENDTPVLGIKEGTAVRVTGDKAELLGGKPAKLFRQGQPAVEISSEAELSALLKSSLATDDTPKPTPP